MLSVCDTTVHNTAEHTTSSLLLPDEYDIVTKPLYLDDNFFFELTDPQEISYTYKLRPAKDFGPHIVSMHITGDD